MKESVKNSFASNNAAGFYLVRSYYLQRSDASTIIIGTDTQGRCLRKPLVYAACMVLNLKLDNILGSLLGTSTGSSNEMTLFNKAGSEFTE